MSLVSATLLATLAAGGQFPIQPDYTYNGVGKPFYVTIKGTGSLSLRLYKPESNETVKSVAVKAGHIQIDKVLPQLWKDKKAEVLYLQVQKGGKSLGPSLVLQPMVNPPVVTYDATAKAPKWEADEDNTYAGVRCWVDQNVLMVTDMGEMEFKMRPDCAPNTVWNFIQLVQGGFYRDIIFHRIVQKHPKTGKMFVIQAGDPTGTGSGSPGYSFALEKSPLKHDFGVLGMARSTDPNTNGSQFYVALSREATQHLDGKYVTYGQLVRGKEVALKIAGVEIGPKDDRPVKPPVIKYAKLVNPKDH